MPKTLLIVLPYLLAAGSSLLPEGSALRSAAAGTALVALASAASSLVATPSASFGLINNGLLGTGLLLCGWAWVQQWQRWRSSPPDAPPRRPANSTHATPKQGPVRRWAMWVLLALLLLPSLWFTLTVAGPEGVSLQGLREAPFSSAAETLLASLLLPATILLAGTWPFGPVARDARFAPLGALLLLLVVVPMLGEGLDHWRSVYAGWLVIGAFAAAITRRWPQLLAAAGLFAIACGGQSVGWAGMALSAIASLLSIVPDLGTRSSVVRRIVSLSAAGCAIAALGVTLGVEVFYSTAMVLATIVAILRTGSS